MNTKYNQKKTNSVILFVLLAFFVLMSNCTADTSEKTTIKKSDPESALSEEKQPKETATPTTDNPAEQSNIEQKTDASALNNVVTFNSFGKVKVGMTVSQASQALGTELVRGNGYEAGCYYVDPQKGFKGVRFMITNGRVARIEIESEEYATDKGAKVGDTESEINILYKWVNVNPQKYDDKKNDMEVYSDDKKYLIIFETDGNRVTGFRVGKTEEVGYVEGCS